VGGALTVAVALVSIPLMPETAFVRPERTRRVEMLATAATGARLVRGRPVLLLLLGTAFFAGAYSEGFDRLWEAHFIRDVGLPSFAGLSAYGSSKAAVIQLTKNMAVELAPIRVNLVAPGFVDTALSASLLGDGLDARRDELRATLPIGRVVGPADVVFISASASSIYTDLRKDGLIGS